MERSASVSKAGLFQTLNDDCLCVRTPVEAKTKHISSLSVDLDQDRSLGATMSLFGNIILHSEHSLIVLLIEQCLQLRQLHSSEPFPIDGNDPISGTKSSLDCCGAPPVNLDDSKGSTTHGKVM
jgi:hypothetical protein